VYVDIPYSKRYGEKMYINKRYDTLQKLVLIAFAQEILRAMGDTREVVGFYPTELIIPTFRSKFMDGVLELDDGTLMNVEFQTGDLDEDFLLRCAQYAVNLRVVSGRHVETNIVFAGSRVNSEKIAFISKYFHFEPKLFFYSEFDGLEKLINIKNKIKNQEKLSSTDHYDLIFIPLMGNVDRVKAAFEVFDIVNDEKIFNEDEQSQIKQCQYVVADIVADGDVDLLNEFMERITMFAGFLVEREKALVESGRTEGRTEGIVEGRDEKASEIAANLKGKLSILEISEITGLSVEKIEKL